MRLSAQLALGPSFLPNSQPASQLSSYPILPTLTKPLLPLILQPCSHPIIQPSSYPHKNPSTSQSTSYLLNHWGKLHLPTRLASPRTDPQHNHLASQIGSYPDNHHHSQGQCRRHTDNQLLSAAHCDRPTNLKHKHTARSADN